MKTLKKIICIAFITIIAVAPALCGVVFRAPTTPLNAASGNWSDYATLEVPLNDDKVVNISTAEKLFYVFNNMKVSAFAYYTINLTANIDLSAHYWNPTGYCFYGHFNGNNYTISGLTEDSATDSGLFDCLGAGAIVENVKLENCKLTNTKSHAGIITAYADNCTSSGEASPQDRPQLKNIIIKNALIEYNYPNYSVNCGILAGECYSIDASNCFVENIKITKTANTNDPRTAYIGGLFGYAGDVNITLSYVKDLIGGGYYMDPVKAYATSNAYAGGICGYINDCTITKCFAQGRGLYANTESSDSGNPYAGGICGYATGTSSVSNCFNRTSIHAEGKEKTENLTIGSFSHTTIYASQDNSTKDWFACDGTYTDLPKKNDGTATGATSASTSTATKTHSNGNAGGICGYADSKNTTISYCYSSNNSDGGMDKYEYVIYFKVYCVWYKGTIFNSTKHKYSDATLFTLKYSQTQYNRGEITSYESKANISNCYGPSSGVSELSSETTSASPSSLSMPSWDDATDKACTESLNVSISSSGISFSMSTYAVKPSHNWTISKPSYSNKYYDKYTEITSANSSVWGIDKSSTDSTKLINNGYPYIKDFYWQYSTQEPTKQ